MYEWYGLSDLSAEQTEVQKPEKETSTGEVAWGVVWEVIVAILEGID